MFDEDVFLADPSVSQIIETLTFAKHEGFQGFGGECGAAAIAINNVLFGGEAEIVGAFNKAFMEKGTWIGHVAVRVSHPDHGTYYLDADARVKDECHIDSWGMLDPDDSDYAEQAADLGIEWNDFTANEVSVITVSEDDIQKHLSVDSVDDLTDILLFARRTNRLGSPSP